LLQFYKDQYPELVDDFLKEADKIIKDES
jgi:hypothetical protein